MKKGKLEKTIKVKSHIRKLGKKKIKVKGYKKKVELNLLGRGSRTLPTRNLKMLAVKGDEGADMEFGHLDEWDNGPDMTAYFRGNKSLSEQGEIQERLSRRMKQDGASTLEISKEFQKEPRAKYLGSAHRPTDYGGNKYRLEWAAEKNGIPIEENQYVPNFRPTSRMKMNVEDRIMFHKSTIPRDIYDSRKKSSKAKHKTITVKSKKKTKKGGK